VIRPRWKKALSDILSYKARSLLVIAAIILGITGVGSILTAYLILSQDIRTNYLGVRPAAAVIWTVPGLTDQDVAAVRARPGVEDAERRPSVMGRILKGEDSWESLRLFVVDDFDKPRLGTFTLEGGRWPVEGELVIERDGWRLIDTPVGNAIDVRVGDSPRHRLRISGRVHDPGQAPSHMDHVVYGYVTRRTYRTLVPDGALDRLLVSVSEKPFDREHIRSVTRDLGTWLGARGISVTRVEVPAPGRHPHQGQLESLLFLLGAIGALSLVLCSILVVNIMAFLLARQVRQIGIMKAIGATPMQVVQIYFFAVACLGGLAAAVGVPLGVAGGKAYARFAARELNFTVLTTELPHWLYLGLAAAAVVLPVVVATIPIRRGTSIPVLRALGDHGLTALGGGDQARPTSPRRFSMPRPLRLAVGGVLRRRGRLLFTVATLGLGLTILAVALNLQATLSRLLEQSAESQRFDLSVFLGRPYPVARVAEALAGVEGIDEVTYWQGGLAPLVYGDGMLSNSYSIVALPARARAFEPVVLEGTWLQEARGDGVVVNQELARAERLSAGSTIELKVGARQHPFVVLGVIKEIGAPTIYVPQPSWRLITGDDDTTTNVRIASSSRDPVDQVTLSRRVERALESARLDVTATLRKAERLKLIKDHLAIITGFLLASSLLALVVSGLGLVSTMGISIIERTRETGVMRAIGASLHTVRIMFLAEGLVVGLLSWVAGLLLAVPMSDAVASFFGTLILDTPLELTLSGAAIPVTLGVMTVFVLVATSSAWTTRSSVREALAYE